MMRKATVIYLILCATVVVSCGNQQRSSSQSTPGVAIEAITEVQEIAATADPSLTPSGTNTPTPTRTSTPTVTLPTDTSTPTPTRTPVPTPTRTPIPTPTRTPIPTVALPTPFATLELMNGPAVELIVNSTSDSDDGSCDDTHCSLREAITAAERRPGPDLITFDHSVFPASEIALIELSSPLPTIYDDLLTIDATGTQATIDGSAFFGNVSGLYIQSSGNVIRGLRIQNMPGAAVCVHSQSDAGINAHHNLLENITAVSNGWENPEGTGRVDSILIHASGVGATAYYNRVINCKVIDSADDGIELVGYEGGSVSFNRVIGNTVIRAAENGIEMDSQNEPGTTSYNIVAYNTIEGVNVEFNGGMSLTAHDGGRTDGNFIAYNSIANTVEWGLYLGAYLGGSVSGNTVVGNSIRNSLDSGLEIQAGNSARASDNVLYLNSVTEADHCPALDGGTDNLWDYRGVGNYWSNYTGIDANLDGIGDSPYFVGPTTADNYPLMSPP